MFFKHNKFLTTDVSPKTLRCSFRYLLRLDSISFKVLQAVSNSTSQPSCGIIRPEISASDQSNAPLKYLKIEVTSGRPLPGTSYSSYIKKGSNLYTAPCCTRRYWFKPGVNKWWSRVDSVLASMVLRDEHAWTITSQHRSADMNSWSCFFAASSYRTTLCAFLPLASLQRTNKQCHKMQKLWQKIEMQIIAQLKLQGIIFWIVFLAI